MSLRHQLRQRKVAWERWLYFTLRKREERRSRQAALRAGERSIPQHLLTGLHGEDEAYFWLRQHGYTVVARRWRSERLRGDLDLVAWDGDTLVIFEVKTLTAGSREEAYRPAEWRVDHEKQKMLRRMAAAYRRQIPERWRDALTTRFDVVSVYLQPGAKPVFEHFRAAFSAVE